MPATTAGRPLPSATVTLLPKVTPLKLGAVKAPQVAPPRDADREEKDKARLIRMSKVSTWAGIGLAAVAVILFIGYALTGVLGNPPGKDGNPPLTSAPVTVTPTVTPGPTRSATPAPSLTPTRSLSDILGLAANINSLRYDVSLSGSGIQPLVYKVWLRKNKMRWEITQQGMNAIVLMDLDARTMYTYLPDQNLAMKTPFDPSQAPDDPLADTRSMQGSNARITGIETLDGKACTVVQYASGQENVKGWIWTEKGLPVRIETVTGAGKTTIEYLNYDFSDIPDSRFTLPAGVKMM
jgi:outer membrane lipoprotein-sorting protein